MTWVNLGVLGIGAALVAVPILLHLLMQPKPVEVTFPALRFLQKRQQTTRARMQLRHFLLLLMRCLLIALAALALAGPSVASSDFGNWLSLGGVGFSLAIVSLILAFAFFRPVRNGPLIVILSALVIGHLVFAGFAIARLVNSESTQLIGDDQAPVAALIVIDSSPRMELQFENETRLEKARQFGDWLIDQFPGDSQVCVLTNDGDEPFFSVDVAAAQRRLENLEVNFSGTRIPETVIRGLDLLLKAPQERKEIYLLTDLTSQSWSGEDSSTLARKLSDNPEPSLFVIDVGVEQPRNFSLGRLILSTAEISPGGRLTLTVDAQRRGPAARRDLKLTLEKIDLSRPVSRDGTTLLPADRYPVQSMNRDFREDSSVVARFSIDQSLDLGTYHGTVEIEGQDGLELDDRRYFSFRVSPTRKTLIVHPQDVNPQVMLSLLAPQDPTGETTPRYQCDSIAQTDFASREDLAMYDAIFLLDPLPLTDPLWQRLEAYVDAGGGLGLFLGHNATQNGMIDPRMTTEAAQRVLGGELDQQWLNESDDLFLSPQELSHPIFRPIQGFETGVLWNRFPIYKHWGLLPNTSDPERPTQTLLRYGNQEPAVVERVIGQGRVLTMTTPITEYGYTEGRRSWNLLLTGKPVPAFLLLTGMAEHLVQSDAESLNVEVGEVSTLRNDLRQFPDTYQAFAPDVEKLPTRLNAVDGQIRYRFNSAPGHYRFRGMFDEKPVLRGFSSNVPPAMTDLARIPPADLDSFLGAERYQLATQESEIQRQQGTTRRGREFYPLIVLIMLVTLAVEHLMSNRFYQ